MENFVRFMVRSAGRKKGFDAFPVVVRKRKTYVFFTWVGLFHWFFLISVAAVAFNYTNNVSIVMISFLASFFLLGLFRNHRLLRKLVLHSISVKPSEEGGTILLRATLHHPKLPFSPGVHLDVAGESSVIDSSGTASKVQLTLPPLPFGVYQLPPVTLFSLWPYGLERTWVILRPSVLVAVLPKTEEKDIMEMTAKMGWDALHESKMGDPDGIRPLAENERGKIAWRDTLRRGKKMTYTYVSSSPDTVTWSWPQDKRSPEEKIREAKSVWTSVKRKGLAFRIAHPSFVSLPAKDDASAFVVLEKLMLLELSPKAWPERTVSSKKWWDILGHLKEVFLK